MPKITTFLTFNDQAEAAATFYTSIFPDSRITHVSRAGSSVVSVSFQLGGQDYQALNGGPHFTFTDGISLFVPCENQAEVDALWDKLCAGGQPGRCGWLKDQFGVSWQVVPAALGRLLANPDPQKAKRTLDALLQMSRIDVAVLEQAAG